MGNPHRGDTPVDVGGQSLTLCYDLNACAQVMNHLEIKSFEKLGNIDLAQCSLSDIIFMLWAGLQRHHPDYTLEQVGELEWDLAEVLPEIGNAFQLGLTRHRTIGDREETGADNAEGKGSRKSGTGTKRGSSRRKQG